MILTLSNVSNIINSLYKKKNGAVLINQLECRIGSIQSKPRKVLFIISNSSVNRRIENIWTRKNYMKTIKSTRVLLIKRDLKIDIIVMFFVSCYFALKSYFQFQIELAHVYAREFIPYLVTRHEVLRTIIKLCYKITWIVCAFWLVYKCVFIALWSTKMTWAMWLTVSELWESTVRGRFVYRLFLS